MNKIYTNYDVRISSFLIELTAGPHQEDIVVYFFDSAGYALELVQPARA